MEYNKINKFNSLSELESYRASINEACNKRAKYLALCERAIEVGDKSFLSQKETFESMAPALFESAEGKKILGRYARTVKGDSNLRNLHALYENIRKADNTVSTDYFVENIVNCNWAVDKKTLRESEKKLGKIISEAYMFLGDEAEKHVISENKTLESAMLYIAQNERSYKNITEYGSAVKVIREAIENRDGEQNIFETREPVSIEKLVKEFNEKYSSKLSDAEIALVKEVADNPNKQEVFDAKKNECVNKINEAINNSRAAGNSEESERLAVIKEQVEKKNFKEESFGEDVSNFVFMSYIIK